MMYCPNDSCQCSASLSSIAEVLVSDQVTIAIPRTHCRFQMDLTRSHLGTG